ncbi:M15 family metallopeptidase [Providencia manganoxydans]|uniref:M15 family metallopeptidase n=1 Tax=Providencia manganoxydans TaxID=2923283 RepID=UPI003AF37023
MNHFRFSQRSENNLKGLNPDLEKMIRRALEISEADFAVIEGLRSREQQAENVKKGVSKTMDSRHLTGNAVDILPSAMKAGMNWNQNAALFTPVLRAIKKAGDELGIKLRFGINWKEDPDLPITSSFIDRPHVEIQK